MTSNSDEASKLAKTSRPETTAASPHGRVWLCSIALTILAGLVLPVRLAKEYEVEISITATGVRHAAGKGSEVWVSEFPLRGMVADAKTPGWERRDQILVSYQHQPTTLHWKGRISPNYQLNFVRHPHSGQMILTINGQSKEYMLYSEKDSSPLEIRPFEFMSAPQPAYAFPIMRAVSTLLGLFILIHFTLLVMLRRASMPAPLERPSPLLCVFFALPSLIFYTLALFAMWPAQMSSDSVSHWAESETGLFSDAHPALPTMALWLVTRIFWHSPAIIPIIQILALTSVTVLILAKLRELGVPRSLCLFIAFVFPLYPANFLMVTTIWKDVPYSIALAFTSYLFLTLVQTQGASVGSRSWRVGFLAAMVIVMFTRHNGVLVALAIPIASAFAYRKLAARFFISSVLGLLATFLFVKSVLFPFFHIPSIPKHYQSMYALHVLAAHRAQGSTFTAEEDHLLEGVLPLERWKSLYNCQSVDPLLFGDAVGTPSYSALAAGVTKLNYLALIKSLKYPEVYLRNRVCATSLLWRIIPGDGEFVSIPPMMIVDFPLAREYGLSTSPKLPQLNTVITKLAYWSLDSSRSWLYWRPGLWLLVTLILGTGLSLALRNYRYVLLTIPAIFNTISLVPLIAAPDYRYQYPVQLIGMLLLPLILHRRTTAQNSPILTVPHSMHTVSVAATSHKSSSPIVRPRISLPDIQFINNAQARVAVVIPCYRVREHILPLLRLIGAECEFIYCVDDKCPDNSGAYIQENNKDSRVRVLFHKENQGVGGAVMTGYEAAISEGATILVKLDGDGQMDPGLIPAFVTPIAENAADYTKGNRFYNVEDLREMPFVRLFGNAALSLLTKLSSGYWSILDPTNGYTAIHASVARALPFTKLERRYFFDSDMLFRLNVLHARVVDIPMAAIYRGEKSNLVISSIVGEFLWKHIRNFVKRVSYNYFLRDFSIASLELLFGFPLAAFGFFFGLHTWIVSITSGVAATAGTVMLSVLPSILGVQFLLSFISHDILRTPAVPIHRTLSLLSALYIDKTISNSEGDVP